MTESISDIIDLCLKCPDYRNFERDCLRSIEEYSCSEETREAIEDMDPTGRKLEEYVTNKDAVYEHQIRTGEALHGHVLKCDMEGCKKLRAYRKNVGVEGY